MTNSTDTAPQPTTEEIAELITEFEKYRERLVSDTLEAAKKAKMSKKETLANLEPELQKIDAALENLRSQYATLTGETIDTERAAE